MNNIKMLLKKFSKYGERVRTFIKVGSNRYTVLFLLGLAVITFAVVSVIARTTTAARGEAEEEHQALLSTPFPNNPTILDLQIQLQNNKLSKPAQESVAEKLEIAQRMAAFQAAGANVIKRAKEAPALPSSASLVMDALDVPEGIYEGSQGLIRPSVAEVSNCWQGVYDGKVIQIFAGSLSSQSEIGVLIIFQEDPVQMTRTMQEVQSQTGTGKLRIISVKNEKVTLRTEEKRKLYFSLETMEFMK